MTDWQPIETAPKEPLDQYRYGPELMFWVNDRPGFGFWDHDFDKWYVEFPEVLPMQPTHWMPLPTPPK